ncbi:MFS transporter, partial [Burkholderia pseudomallei]
VEIWLGAGPSTFCLMQACGVAAYMLSAARSGKWSDALGLDRLIALGALLQFAASAAFLLLAYADGRSTPLVVASWMLFCGALGLRGP